MGDGQLGFISYPRYTTLIVNAKVWEGDPIKLMRTEKDGTSLIAGIGVELSTRRRNKLAGKITNVKKQESILWNIQIEVNEAIGNCPKYIPQRELVPFSKAAPKVLYENRDFSDTDRLPTFALSLIQQSDTVFFGSSHSSSTERFSSHVGMNIRGGRPGFVRVRSDKRTLVLPDYSGNRFFTTLGNIEATPFASITFPSFTTGDILYITGRAQNVVDDAAGAIMFQQNRLTLLEVTGCVFIENALPVRQRAGTQVGVSPYSPPVRYLAEETKNRVMLSSGTDAVEASLTHMNLHAPNIGTFSFSTSAPVDVTPGQAIILDLKSFLGLPSYRHMAPGDPVSLNDDRIRTWTVSAISQSRQEFSITLKLKEGGAATGAFFMIARSVQPAIRADAARLNLRLPVLGVTGDFGLKSVGTCNKKALMIAGGIGVTPFLCMLKAAEGWDVRMLFATREPEVLVPLVLDAAKDHVNLTMDVFSAGQDYARENTADYRVAVHSERLTETYLVEKSDEWADRIVFVCGPAGIQNVATNGLTKAGVSPESIMFEGFAY